MEHMLYTSKAQSLVPTSPLHCTYVAGLITELSAGSETSGMGIDRAISTTGRFLTYTMETKSLIMFFFPLVLSYASELGPERSTIETQFLGASLGATLWHQLLGCAIVLETVIEEENVLLHLLRVPGRISNVS